MWPKDEYPEEKRTMMLLGTPISLNNDHCIWENEIDLHCFPYLKDHRTKSLGKLTLNKLYYTKSVKAICKSGKKATC